MSFAVIGVNHKNCPAPVRERVTFTQSKLLEGLKNLKDQGIQEVVILSTCNRSEIYIEDPEIKDAIQKVVDFYKAYAIRSQEEKHRPLEYEGNLEDYLFTEEGEMAIRHLFRVAVGLDSIVLGEDQILGQVKKAYSDAMEQGASGKVLNKIFREAISLGKKVKHEVKISEHPLSISHIAIKFLKQKQGTLKGKKGLMIGLGQMNELTVKYLIEEELEGIYVTNRSHGKVITFSEIYPEIIPIDYEKRYEILSDMDFVISATASPHTILTYEEMPKLHKPLDIMDIAMPRDIDARIDELPMASVYHVDHLKKISEENSAMRVLLAEKAEGYIDEAIEKLMKWIDQLEVQEVVQGLDAYCGEIKEHTIRFLSKKLKTPIEEETLELILTETLKRCIRTPIAKLMSMEKGEREGYAKVLNELFDSSK